MPSRRGFSPSCPTNVSPSPVGSGLASGIGDHATTTPQHPTVVPSTRRIGSSPADHAQDLSSKSHAACANALTSCVSEEVHLGNAQLLRSHDEALPISEKKSR
jgi:hypothetical protein